MKKLSLVLTYSKYSFTPQVSIEQERMADNSLTTDDLTKMISLARSGVSAKLYRPETCNVSVVGGEVLADLVFYTWPKPFDLEYTTSINYGTLSDKVALVQDREFDFILNLSKKTELPFCVESISYSKTQLPFFDSRGNIVDPPVITFDDRFVYTDREVIGVIRIRCRAIGYQHVASLSFTKDDNEITNINITASTSWKYDGELQTQAEQLELPGCLELLLTTCEDDLLTERKYGSVNDKEDLIPVVYYSDCDGSFLALRYERP